MQRSWSREVRLLLFDDPNGSDGRGVNTVVFRASIQTEGQYASPFFFVVGFVYFLLNIIASVIEKSDLTRSRMV